MDQRATMEMGGGNVEKGCAMRVMRVMCDRVRETRKLSRGIGLLLRSRVAILVDDFVVAVAVVVCWCC